MPLLLVKNAGSTSDLYVTTGTPKDSRTSRVFGISRIDLIPEQTTAVRVRDSSWRSHDTSMVDSAP